MDRRSFISAAAATGAVISFSLPAAVAAAGTDPVAAYWTAFHAYSAGLITEEQYNDAFYVMDRWEPKTERDFIRKFIARFDEGGAPTDAQIGDLIKQANRLLGDF